MDRKDIAAVRERAEVARAGNWLPAMYESDIVSYVEEYVRHGTANGFHLPSELPLNDVAALFGLGSLAGKTVVRRHYSNKHSGLESNNKSYSQPLSIEVPTTIEDVLQDIGSEQTAYDDDPNDFHAGCAVQLDATTLMVFGVDNTEYSGGLCDDCEADPEVAQYIADCNHTESSFDARYWFLLCSPDHLGAVDWERGDIF